jgi:hypothetical protein
LFNFGKLFCAQRLLTAPVAEQDRSTKHADPHQVFFSVCGVNKEKEKAYRWVNYDLLVGNRIEIRVIETKSTDVPQEYGCPGGSCAV